LRKSRTDFSCGPIPGRLKTGEESGNVAIRSRIRAAEAKCHPVLRSSWPASRSTNSPPAEPDRERASRISSAPNSHMPLRPIRLSPTIASHPLSSRRKIEKERPGAPSIWSLRVGSTISAHQIRSGGCMYMPIRGTLTENDTLGYHFKTGHQLSLQNRPTEPYPGPDDVLPCRAPFRQVPLAVNVFSGEPQGDRARGISAERFEIPLAGGAGARIVTALLAGTRRGPAWGEPSPPRLSPGGNGKRGVNSLRPQANCFWAGYLMKLPLSRW
jgi:hypothetical protein